jgi:hypothetical protein
MIGTSAAGDLVNDRTHFGRPFLTSSRAYAACTRELARLSDEVLRGVALLGGAMHDEKPTIRRSPDRCIVQLGPVALTVAWLRGNNDTVASGELLIIVWRGSVAPRKDHNPERPTKGPAPLGATPLWEQVLSAVGESEQTWGWHPPGAEIERCSSIELAERCVGRLQAAYMEGVIPQAGTLDAVALS